MMKDIRKALGTFWCTQFLQGVIFEDFPQKPGFRGSLETILGQFTAQLRVCEPLRFLLLLAARRETFSCSACLWLQFAGVSASCAFFFS